MHLSLIRRSGYYYRISVSGVRTGLTELGRWPEPPTFLSEDTSRPIQGCKAPGPNGLCSSLEFAKEPAPIPHRERGPTQWIETFTKLVDGKFTN
jgi:hypothetical protein